MDYIFYILILVDIFIILAVSLNLLMGFTGLISMAHAGFMAIGAYTTTLLITSLGMNFFLTIPLGVLIAGLVSALLALPSLRVKGEHYIIASFGLQIILYNILLNWVSLTNGPYGFSGIPRPRLLGYTFGTYRSYLVLASLITLVCVFIIWRITRSRFGLVLRGIREDEIAASSLGKNVNRFKVIAFVAGSSVAAVAGSLYATAISFIDPFCFTVHDSIFMLAVVIIGKYLRVGPGRPAAHQPAGAFEVLSGGRNHCGSPAANDLWRAFGGLHALPPAGAFAGIQVQEGVVL